MYTDSRFVLHNHTKTQRYFSMTYQDVDYGNIFILEGLPETGEAELFYTTENYDRRIEFRFAGTWKDFKIEGLELIREVLLKLKSESK